MLDFSLSADIRMTATTLLQMQPRIMRLESDTKVLGIAC